jgi:hypothetical protein
MVVPMTHLALELRYGRNVLSWEVVEGIEIMAWQKPLVSQRL